MKIKKYLSREDFKVAVLLLFGYKPSKVEVDAVMFSVKPENSVPPEQIHKSYSTIQFSILFEKFLDLMSARKAAQLYNSKTRQIFTAFDVQSRGSLTFEDFRKTFNSVSPKISGRVVPAAFRKPLNAENTPWENKPRKYHYTHPFSHSLMPPVRDKPFGEVDQDSDGHISFKDFESAMKYGQDEGSLLYFA